jgi:hypothetical protein
VPKKVAERFRFWYTHPARNRPSCDNDRCGIASALTELLRNHQNGYASTTDNAVDEVDEV